MTPADKQQLKGQLTNIKSQLQASKALAAVAHGMAQAPAMSPSGPVTIPALAQICTALDGQIRVLEATVDFLEKQLEKI